MHETCARAWCTGKTQRDWVEREVGDGSGWGTHISPWLIHVNVWQKPLQYCKVISLQLLKINGKKKTKKTCLPMQEMQVPSLGWENHLEEEMATHSSLAWRIPWTEEPDRL